jgi:7,8-dihydropterin-6-yl-methyl-4-(beta-D-ribofuranosyl)aminobenzene 5'-phosphate synthase
MKVRILSVLLLLTLISPMNPQGMTAQEARPPEAVLTVLFDNFTDQEALQTGWGFAVLVETGDHTILFDTGADGEILLENMRLLGKDPLAVEAVVLSHAHGDHTGGLEALLATGVRPRLFLLPGFPPALRNFGGDGVERVIVAPGDEILPGIRTTGQVEGSVLEQALVFETRDGPLVLTGCAHPGPARMAEMGSEVAGRPVFAVLGGFHLFQATSQEVQGVISGFQDMGVVKTGATHCTGPNAIQAFEEAFGDDFMELGVGRVLRFPLL